MVYPHFDIDDIVHLEDAALEWMNLDAGELEDIKCLLSVLWRSWPGRRRNSKPNGRKKPVI